MKKLRVLLLEPDKILGRSYATALEAAGCVVDWATTAEGAVRLADIHTPNIAVVELQIAQHNGVEFLYEFKSYSEWMDVPVVIHTVLRPEEIVRIADLPKGLGIVATLHKSHTSLTQLCAAARELAQ